MSYGASFSPKVVSAAIALFWRSTASSQPEDLAEPA